MKEIARHGMTWHIAVRCGAARCNMAWQSKLNDKLYKQKTLLKSWKTKIKIICYTRLILDYLHQALNNPALMV